MPGGFPLGLEICHAIEYNPTPNNQLLGTNVVSGGTANTKGSYTQLVASASADACWVRVVVGYLSIGAGSEAAVDIAIGASGSEIVLIPNLKTTCNNTAGQVTYSEYNFPLSIPAGTRIAAAAQANLASDNIYVTITLFDGAFTQIEGAAGVDAIGFNSSTTIGTLLTSAAGNVSTGKGAYAQLTAATARDYIGFMVGVDWQALANQGFYYALDIAIGASGSEIIIVPDLVFYNSAPCAFPFCPMPIPAGTRIAARIGAVFGAGYKAGLTLYGVYK